MARKGTAMPMKLPSGQVVWIRVEDDEEPELPPPPAPWSVPSYGAAPPPGAGPSYGGTSAYGDAPSYGSPETYVGVPLPPPGSPAPPPPPGSPYAYEPPYPPSMPAPGAPPPPPPPPPPSYEPNIPEQWTPPYEHRTAPDYGSPAPGAGPDAPRGPSKGWAGLLRPRKAVQQSVEDAKPLHGFTEAVSGIAESVRDGLRHAKPDTVEIEFGLDIDVSAGAAVSLIADARAKAAVRITLGWDNRERAEGATRVIEGTSVEGKPEDSGEWAADAKDAQD